MEKKEAADRDRKKYQKSPPTVARHHRKRYASRSDSEDSQRGRHYQHNRGQSPSRSRDQRRRHGDDENDDGGFSRPRAAAAHHYTKSSRVESRSRSTRKARIDRNIDFSSESSDSTKRHYRSSRRRSPRRDSPRRSSPRRYSKRGSPRRGSPRRGSPRRGSPRRGSPRRDYRRQDKSESGSQSASPNSEDSKNKREEEEPIEKEKPCFTASGILAEYSNKLNGVVLKFTEPIDAAPPTLEIWGLYPFQNDQPMQSVTLRAKDDSTSAFLLGRDQKVAHIHLNEASCSSQHAVIQFRKKLKVIELTPEEQLARGTFEAFMQEFSIVPYLMDLESTNGTFLNGEQVDGAKYVELRSKDVLKFGTHPVEYVVMKQ